MWQVADTPESVSIVGRLAGAANGSARCAASGFVVPSVLYPWPADSTTACACEVSGAKPAFSNGCQPGLPVSVGFFVKDRADI